MINERKANLAAFSKVIGKRGRWLEGWQGATVNVASTYSGHFFCKGNNHIRGTQKDHYM